MIDFGLSEDQEALQRSAREFLAAECPPALVRERQAEVGLADARRAVDHGERAGQEPAAEHPVEPGHPGGDALCHADGF